VTDDSSTLVNLTKYRVYFKTKSGHTSVITIRCDTDEAAVRATLNIAGVRSLEDIKEMELHGFRDNQVYCWSPVGDDIGKLIKAEASIGAVQTAPTKTAPAITLASSTKKTDELVVKGATAAKFAVTLLLLDRKKEVVCRTL
jgi:hypothetical protein